ncbi:MAG: class I SAM-dependent methyltransferase [Planctomycetes bacterium]|nr:class I SAM-dependent methyltransferase [Planctomycetota bacterium]
MTAPRKPADRHPKKPHAATTDWSAVAAWYDNLVGEEGSEYQREVVLPGVLRLLACRAGERVLDVACGQGVLCRLLHAAGVKVTGVDAAEPLIKLARERSDKAVRYSVGDARSLGALPALTPGFDAAACVLAIQNIDPMKPVFEGVAKLLRPGGRFVMAMMHPCFRGPKQTHWGWDESKGVQYRRVDRYLLPRREPIVTHPGKDPTGYTWTFHRPVQSYAAALGESGLLIDRIEEWTSHKVSTSGPRAGAENRTRKEIPMFMAIRAVKASLDEPRP